MPNVPGFKSNWASKPGETISDLMRVRRTGVVELALSLGRPVGFTAGLIDGEERINKTIAIRLSRELGGSPKFWLQRERQYRNDVRRLKREKVEC